MPAKSIVVLLVLVAGVPALAQDRFEIQVYDAETAPRGAIGLEVHFNVVAVGAKEPSPEGELATDRVTHLTFEPHIGLASWCELGVYLQTALRPSGAMELAGGKLRFKARIPRRLAAGLIGLALNLELSAVPFLYEAHIYGTELRPVIDVRWKKLYLSINPIVSIDLAGPSAGRPQLEPAAKIALDVSDEVALGVEYYAGLGPVTGFAAPSEQSHLLFAVVDALHRMSAGIELGLNLGVGYNLVGTGDQWIVKAIFGVGR